MIYFISTEGVNNGNTGFVWNSGTPWWWVYYAVYVFANVGIWGYFLCFYGLVHLSKGMVFYWYYSLLFFQMGG